MGYLAVGDTRAAAVPAFSPETLVAQWQRQPRQDQLAFLTRAMADVNRHFGLAQMKMVANSRWKDKWTKTFGLGAALLGFATSLSLDTAKKAYSAGGKVGTWLASHQDAPEDVKTELANAQYWLQVVAPLSATLNVAPGTTAADLRHQLEQGPVVKVTKLNVGIPTRRVAPTTRATTRTVSPLLLAGGALLALYWWRRRRRS